MFNLDEFMPYRLTRAGQDASQAVADRYAKVYGLSVSQWRVLAHLSKKSGISVNELGRAAGLDRVSTSRACSALQKQGWINKLTDANDKRLLVIELTALGQEQWKELAQLALQAEKDYLSSLTLTERQTLMALLLKLERT